MLESGIGRAHNIHLASLPNFTLPGDIAASKRYYQPDLIEPAIEVAPDGTIAVPDGPGIGVNIVRERVDAGHPAAHEPMTRQRTPTPSVPALLAAARRSAVAARRPRRRSRAGAAGHGVYEQKMRWILQLEDERQLRGGGGDLLALLQRSGSARPAAGGAGGRAACSLPEAVPALTDDCCRANADPEVRQMAAFALGLIGDAAAAPALMTALADRRSADPGPRRRSARPDRAQAGGRRRSARWSRRTSAPARSNGIDADDMGYPEGAGRRGRAPRRLRARAARVRTTRWRRRCSTPTASRAAAGGRWPTRFSASTIRARRRCCSTLFKGDGQLTRAFAARGLGALEGSARGRAAAGRSPTDAGEPLAVRIQAVRGLARIGDARGGAGDARV